MLLTRELTKWRYNVSREGSEAMGAFWGPLYRQTTEPFLTPEVTAVDVHVISSNLKNLPAVGPIVDLGCGNGRHIPGVMKLTGREVVGVDFDAESLNEAITSGFKVVHADFANLPFDDAQIAGVYSWSNTLYSVHPMLRKRALVEVARVLAPNGLLVFQTIAPEIAEQMRGARMHDIPTGLVMEEGTYYRGRLKLKRWFKRASDGKIMVGNCELYCHTDKELLSELGFFDLRIKEIIFDGPMRVVVAERAA